MSAVVTHNPADTHKRYFDVLAVKKSCFRFAGL